MKSQRRSPRPAAEGGAAADADVYDERHRQTKALEQYERQKAAWSRMQAHLLSATAPSSSAVGAAATTSTGHHAATAMTRATAAARARREDYEILHAATAETRLGNGSYAWESLLRCSSAQETRRLVPIGRTCAPGPLFSEVHDPSTLADDHASFARVVSEEDVARASGGTGMPGGTRPDERLGHADGPFDVTTKFQSERASAQEHVRSALLGTAAAAQGSSSKGRRHSAGLSGVDGAPGHPPAHTDATQQPQRPLSPATYYEQQLRRAAPYVQHRLGHFLQPRVFLHVDGHPAPYASPAEEEQAEWLRELNGGSVRSDSAPAVEFVAPLPPPAPPQTQQLWVPPSNGPSRLPSRHGFHHGPGAGNSQRGATHPSPRLGHVSVADSVMEDMQDSLDSAGPQWAGGRGNGAGDGGGGAAAQRTLPPSPLHPMRVAAPRSSRATDAGNKSYVTSVNTTTNNHNNNNRAEYDDGGGVAGSEAGVEGPAMELSTRSLFFQTAPHQLLHGSVTLRNTGTTTIYYSWAVVDVMQEHLRDLYEAEHAGSHDGAESASAGSNTTREASAVLSDSHGSLSQKATAAANALPFTSLRLTHQLAAHQHAARESFFFLSTPLNGVVLPGDDLVVSFSVRGGREGLFQSTYELLTVPPAPERIFVQLRALVQCDGPPLSWLAAPVEAALEAKVRLDAPRRLLQQLASDSAAVEQAALQRCVAELDSAAQVSKLARADARRRQEEAWNRANRLSLDCVPYYPAVYDAMSLLWTVVRQTHATLTSDGAATHAVSSTSSPTPVAIAATAAAAAAAVIDEPQTPASGPLTPPNEAVASLPDAVDSASSLSCNTEWDGAVLPLLHQILCIRDRALRHSFMDALQVLLRAARAPCDAGENSATSSAHTYRTAVDPREDEDDEKDDSDDDDGSDEALPLSVLLDRAAIALAETVVARQAEAVEKRCEDLLVQPVAPAQELVLTLPHVPDNTGAGKGRTTSMGAASAVTAATKKSVAAAAAKSARGTVAAMPESKEQGLATSATAAAADTVGSAVDTPLGLLESALAPAVLQGFSVAQANPDMMTKLRAAEERVVRARLDEDLMKTKSELAALHAALFREVVDAACHRDPLATCTPARLAELRQVQQSPPLVVDASLDALVAPPASKPGKRK